MMSVNTSAKIDDVLIQTDSRVAANSCHSPRHRSSPRKKNSKRQQDGSCSTSKAQLFNLHKTTALSSPKSLHSPAKAQGSNIVLSKYARDAQVVQAEFVKSSVKTEDCASDGLPELRLLIGQMLANLRCSIRLFEGKNLLSPLRNLLWRRQGMFIRYSYSDWSYVITLPARTVYSKIKGTELNLSSHLGS
ncbi:hypothetical protein EZV62_013413 [Acer yangbiense]|uniref:Uncharacterized protein n=1 Tax=Acer yangbiense TaxID=1000413 RepID=A0A5C7HYM8_9ROSI|nr:hypothetical protein EZV62_013413 [Acer yangbiense]